MKELDLQHIRTVLLDIEGTICPISFVKDVLFPYALSVLPTVLAQKWDDLTFVPFRDAFPAEARASPELLEAHVRDLTARDVKVASLKGLQGYLWRTGFESGVYTSPLFADVVPRLKGWNTGGIQLAIFSSGSVAAQKLLFQHVGTEHDDAKGKSEEGKLELVGDNGIAHGSSRKRKHDPEGSIEGSNKMVRLEGDGDRDGDSEDRKKMPKKSEQNGEEENKEDGNEQEGVEARDLKAEGVPEKKPEESKLPEKPKSSIDLTNLFSGFFDTVNGGPKTEEESYVKIATELGRKAEEVLFLSDNVLELQAAVKVNMSSILVIRPGNAEISSVDKVGFTIVSSLDEVKGLPVVAKEESNGM